MEVWDKDLMSEHDRLGSCRIPLDYALLVDSHKLHEESKREIRERGLEGSVDDEIDPNKMMPAPAWIPLVSEQKGNWRVGDGVGLLPSSASLVHTLRSSAALPSGTESKSSFAEMLGLDDRSQMELTKKDMLDRLRAHAGGLSASFGDADCATADCENPAIGLGDGGRGFSSMPPNGLELAVLNGNDHEANRLAIENNPELGASVLRRQRLAQDLLGAQIQVSFDLTPTDPPLIARKKRMRARRRRLRRLAKLNKFQHEEDVANDIPQKRETVANLANPSRMIEGQLGAEAPQAKPWQDPVGVIVETARRSDPEAEGTSSKAIRASRDSHLLRIAKEQSVGVGSVAVAASKSDQSDNLRGKPRIAKLVNEMLKREEELVTRGETDHLVIDRL